MSCKVKNCRLTDTHTTIAHKCGRCREFGHGVLECFSIPDKDRLKTFHGDVINFLRRCDIENCQHPDTHSREAHHCSKCKNRHPESDCIIQTLNYHINRFPEATYLQNFNSVEFMSNHHNENVVVPIMLAMGCQLFIRIKNGNMFSLFMHNDCWGQYGRSEDLEIYQDFIYNCRMLDGNSYSWEELTI